MDKHVALIPEHPGAGRLGRAIEHDPKSRNFAVRAAQPGALRSVLWHRHVGVYDQGQTGSCTGQALAGALSTTPFRHRLHEPSAMMLYKSATVLDDIPGAWPEDTGSSSLGVCKAAVKRGWLTRYEHAFSINAALTALQSGPLITGITWLDSFDNPSASGEIVATPGAAPRGGHELCVVGVDTLAKTVRFVNSWGESWGDKGFGVMSWSLWEMLLEDSGDATVPVVPTA